MDIRFYQSQDKYRVYFDKGYYKNSFFYDIDRTGTTLYVIEKQNDEHCLRKFCSKYNNGENEEWTLIKKESISPDIQGQIDDLLYDEYSNLENKINRLSFLQKGSICKIAQIGSNEPAKDQFYVTIEDDNVFFDVDELDFLNTSSFAKESLFLSFENWIKTQDFSSLPPKKLIVHSQGKIIETYIFNGRNN